MKVDTRYVGFRPIVSDNGPAKKEPEPIPNRYIAVDRSWAVWDTPNSRLARSLAGESAEPAHPCVNIRNTRIPMFLDLDSSVQFLGSSGSASPLVFTQIQPWLSGARMRLALSIRVYSDFCLHGE